MQLETGLLAWAVLAGAGTGALLLWRQGKTMSIPKIVAVIIGVGFAVYYILHVVFGKGRTGWP